MTRPDAHCLLCDAAITRSNDSLEHVVPNALGGRLTVRRFLCKPCNDKTGHNWDAPLVSQLQGLALLVGVDRERGETPAMVVTTTAGEALRMTANDGLFQAKPTFEMVETEDGTAVRIAARTMSEARAMIEGLKRRYPKIDVEAALAQAKQSWSLPKGLMQHQFVVGGFEAGRSIVKSALAFAAHAGLPIDSCQEAVSFLREPADLPAPLGWYYQHDVLEGRPPETPVTCVGLHANPTTGLVLGYVEYFGFHRAVIELGRRYQGTEVQEVYGFDPRNAQILPLRIALPFDAAELEAIFDYRRIPDGAMDAAIAQVLTQALKRQSEKEQHRVFGAAVRFGLEQSGLSPGDEITEAHARQIAAATTGYLMPWIMNQVAGRRHPRKRDA